MASPTVTVPGVGPVRRDVLIGGGALVAGIVGVAWWRARGTASAAAAAEIVPGDEFGDDFASEAIGDPGGGPTTGSGGGSTVVAPDPDTLPPRTNGEWTQRAISRMGDIGYEPVLVSSALGKYLSRKTLTAAEADLVGQARAILGPPPEGEFPVTLAPAPAVPTPAAPVAGKRPAAVTGARVAAVGTDTLTLTWRAVSGQKPPITHYVVQMVGRGPQTTQTPSVVVRNLWRKRTYTFQIWAVSPAGTGGVAVVKGTTK